MKRVISMPQDEESTGCTRWIREEVVWTRKARRATLLEHRRRDTQEEQEFTNILSWLGGVTPAEDALQLRATELRRLISDKRTARLAKWSAWMKRAWKETP